MRSVEELERLFLASPAPPRERGTLRLICVRAGEGVHVTPARVSVSPEGGVEGDRWSAKPTRDRDDQVTLMEWRVVELVAGDTVAADAAGDNFLVDIDLSAEALPPGSRLRLGSAVLEVTAKPHTGCKKFKDRFGLAATTWVNARKERRLRGINCRVIAAGEAAVGDAVRVLPPATPREPKENSPR
jgi:MOSC domain-containing protein YiiM